MPLYHGSGALYHGNDAFVGGVPEIASVTVSSTSIAVAWTGAADEYRINNGTATALPDGASPDTITGLTANTEYNAPGLQLRYLGGAWSAPVAFGTTNVGSGSGSLPGTSPSSGAVVYLPLRMVSGLWSTSGVTPSVPPGSEAWLPSIRQPFGYLDPRDGKLYCDPIWYRAFEYAFEKRLGGRGAPSVPDVVSTVAATQETAAAASATIAEVAQQTQANAEALFVVREVVQGGALDGADQIPGVDLR